MRSTDLLRPANSCWLILYLLMIGGIVVGMLWSRTNVEATFTDPESQASWERWRGEVARQQGGEGPVSRRVPKSAQPPALVLLRDHFGVCLAGALLLSTLLFGSSMVMIRGVMSSPPQIDYSDPD